MKELTVVKIGGSLLEDTDRLERLLDSFSAMQGRTLLVHGGGPQANRIGRALGIEQQMWNGRRITDAATLDLVTMVYAGLNSKRIVALLQKRGCNAVGMSGADGDIVRGAKRPVGDVDFGFVGDIAVEGIGAATLALLLENGYVPVLNAITHDGDGQLLNTNADTIAATVAAALARFYRVDLLFVHNRPGVLGDVNNDGSVIRSLHPAGIAEMKEAGTIASGMLPKIDNALAALRCGVESVRIGDEQILEGQDRGTRIIIEEEQG